MLLNKCFFLVGIVFAVYDYLNGYSQLQIMLWAMIASISLLDFIEHSTSALRPAIPSARASLPRWMQSKAKAEIKEVKMATVTPKLLSDLDAMFFVELAPNESVYVRADRIDKLLKSNNITWDDVLKSTEKLDTN